MKRTAKQKNGTKDFSGATRPSKYAIAVILVVGIIAAVASQWYYHRLQQRPLALWGMGSAKLMLNAPLIVALHLAPAEQVKGKPEAENFERININGLRLVVLESRDVTAAPGISHLRHSLVNDGSFDWSATDENGQPAWEYALDFEAGDVSAMVMFAPKCNRALLVETGTSASVSPIMPGIVRFMHEQFPPPREEKASPATEMPPAK